MVLTYYISVVCYHGKPMLSPVSRLPAVFNPGLLPPDRACRDWRAPHAAYDICPYGFFHTQQYNCGQSSDDFLDGGVLCFAVTEVPYTTLVYLWYSEPVNGFDYLVYTATNCDFGYA